MPTDDGYLSTIVEGTFSNSATTNDELIARMIVDEGSCAVALYEYDSYRVKGSYDIAYDVKVKDGKGDVHTMRGYLYDGGDRVYFSDYELMIDILSQGGVVRFNLTNRDRPIEEYTFSIDATDFLDTFEILFPFSTTPLSITNNPAGFNDSNDAMHTLASSHTDGSHEDPTKDTGDDVPVTLTIKGVVNTTIDKELS